MKTILGRTESNTASFFIISRSPNLKCPTPQKYINSLSLWNIILGMRNHIFIPRNKESHLLMSWASQEGMFLEFHPNNKQPKFESVFFGR